MILASSAYASSASGYVNTILDVVLAAILTVIARTYFNRKQDEKDESAAAERARKEDEKRWSDMNDAMNAQTMALQLIVQKVGEYDIPTVKTDVNNLKVSTAQLRVAVRTLGGNIDG